MRFHGLLALALGGLLWLPSPAQGPAAEARMSRVQALTRAPATDRTAEQLWALIREKPSDEASGEALTWLVTPRAHFEPDPAIALLSQYHTRWSKVGRACQMLAYSQSQAGEQFLRQVLAQNPSHQAQGQACFALADLLRHEAQVIGIRRDHPVNDPRTDWLKGRDSRPLEAEATKLLERCAGEFGDVPQVAEAARRELHEVKDLAVGRPAPELAGLDPAGKPLKLADFRGKAVLLIFWSKG